MTELLKVTTTGFQKYGDRALCMGCDQRWNTGYDTRLPALQHARLTGHTVRVIRQTYEDIKPYGEDEGG